MNLVQLHFQACCLEFLKSIPLAACCVLSSCSLLKLDIDSRTVMAVFGKCSECTRECHRLVAHLVAQTLVVIFSL